MQRNPYIVTLKQFADGDAIIEKVLRSAIRIKDGG
jgi:hypothetical protein